MDDQPRPDVAIKGVVGERRGLLQQSRGVPVVMLDEAVGEIHPSLSSAGLAAVRRPAGESGMPLGAESRKSRGSSANRLGGTP